ncbi:hypothetical protein Ddc_06748 [Ditylenchus destructor]|nr:hypothetical protein Ddc_06748 [Ditylenchus destructor]
MAQVIRKHLVYKKYGRWWRYLPRRDDSRIKYDYDAPQNLPMAFEDPMPCEPPKLWVSWLYCDITKRSAKVQDLAVQLFGTTEPGVMNVFPNTASTNRQLWKLKHVIDIRPMTFPNGEPTMENVANVEILHDGRCVIDRKLAPDPEGIQLLDTSKQFTPSYLASRLKSRDMKFKDVYEDNVYNPENMTIYD